MKNLVATSTGNSTNLCRQMSLHLTLIKVPARQQMHVTGQIHIPVVHDSVDDRGEQELSIGCRTVAIGRGEQKMWSIFDFVESRTSLGLYPIAVAVGFPPYY